MVYAVLRIKPMVRLLTLDLEVLDEKVAKMCEERLDFLIATSRLPLCPLCRNSEQTNIIRPGGKVVRVEDSYGNLVMTTPTRSRNCCVNECRKEVPQECYQGCLRKTVQEHVKIMELVTLVDESFRLSVMVYNQFGEVAAVLAIPKIGSPTHLSAREYLNPFFEVIGMLAWIAVFSHCGQTVLDESETLRLAVVNCHSANHHPGVSRSLLIMSTVAKKPLRLTSGTIFTLSLESYTTILSATYSYANLLQSLKTPE